MAGCAVITQAAFVYVLTLVAVHTALRGALEAHRGMALSAARQHMLAQQRVAGEIVIETNAASPGLVAMTLVASSAQLAAVRVLRPMAGGTGVAELLFTHLGRVTDVTAQLGVRAEQGEVGTLHVVVFHRLPMRFAVATLAIGSEARGM